MLALLLLLMAPLQNEQNHTYITLSGGQPVAREEVRFQRTGDELTVHSDLRTRTQNADSRFQTELVADAATLAPRSYRVRSTRGPDTHSLEFRVEKNAIHVTAGPATRQVPREADALLLDPVPIAHIVMLIVQQPRQPRRTARAQLAPALAAVQVTLEERGETTLILKGNVVPVRKVFVQIEPLGMMAYVGRDGRVLVITQPFQNQRFALEGFEDHEISRRSGPALPEGVKEIDATFKSGELEIAGTLTAPKSGRGPAALILGGPGAVDRDGNTLDLQLDVYKTIAYSLSAAGFVVFRYDKRGVGKSEGNLGLATLNDLVEDAREALRWLRAADGVDADRVALVGHDEGALIAALLAAQDLRVKAAALLAAPADSLDAILLRQLETSARAQKLAEPEIQRAVAERRAQFEKIKASTENWLELGQQGKIFVGWLREHFNQNPTEAAKKLRCPAVLAHGENDRQIPPDHTDRLEAALKEAKVKHEAARFKNLDHLFMESAGGEVSRYADDRPVDPGFLRYLADALKRLVP